MRQSYLASGLGGFFGSRVSQSGTPVREGAVLGRGDGLLARLVENAGFTRTHSEGGPGPPPRTAASDEVERLSQPRAAARTPKSRNAQNAHLIITPNDLAQRWKVRPLQARRVLRALYGTLAALGRGPRWYLTAAEVARVTVEAKRRGWC